MLLALSLGGQWKRGFSYSIECTFLSEMAKNGTKKLIHSPVGEVSSSQVVVEPLCTPTIYLMKIAFLTLKTSFLHK